MPNGLCLTEPQNHNEVFFTTSPSAIFQRQYHKIVVLLVKWLIENLGKMIVGNIQISVQWQWFSEFFSNLMCQRPFKDTLSLVGTFYTKRQT